MKDKTPSYEVDQATGHVRIRPRAKLLERLPPTVAAAAALDALHIKLAVATEFFEHHGDAGRHGVYRAMVDVIDVLASLGIPRATLAPIAAVAAAIVDAERGAESNIFKPRRRAKGGKPPAKATSLEFEGHLVTVTECCVRHVRTSGARPYIEPACELAAKMINGSRWRVRVTATQLRELRERVQQSPRKSPDRIMLETFLTSEVGMEAPLVWAQLLLEHDWVSPPPELSA